MTTPSDDDLTKTLIELRSSNATLGIAKLHAQLLAEHSDWAVSEKRTRKLLQAAGLVLGPAKHQPNTADGGDSDVLIPVSKVIDGLDIGKWSAKVQVEYFNRKKGKGLVVTAKIDQGETIWKEDPWILAPEWDIYQLQVASAACGHCSTPLHGLSNPALIINCEGQSQTPSCPARFCNRLCFTRSKKVHPLLCPAQNPSSIPLLRFAQTNQWQSLHALAHCSAKLLLSEQRDEDEFRQDWNIVSGLAQLGMEERAKGGWLGNSEPDRATWKTAHGLYIQAFKDPPKDSDKKKLSKLLRRTVSPQLADELFPYDAFLRGLGRMNLNIESHGGLYVLHSHVNHSCDPNVSARHLDQRSALARVTMVALKDIEPGAELFITYVNPRLPLETRRQHLLEWGFGACDCARCVAEEQDPNREVPEKVISADLEAELKSGLGVV